MKLSLWPNGSPAEMSNTDTSSMLATPNGITDPQANNVPTNYAPAYYASSVNYVPANNACYAPFFSGDCLSTGLMRQQHFREYDNVQRQYQAERAYTGIISMPNGLWVRGRSGKLHCVFPRQFQRCIFVRPDIRYGTASCYYIYFYGTSKPLILTQREFDDSKRLSNVLSQHFNTPVQKYGSQSKTDTLLRIFFASESETVDIHYYFGWSLDDGIWKYHLWNGKTHATSADDISDLVEVFISGDNSMPVPICASAVLVSLEQTIEMMYAITSKKLRNLLWVMLHVSSLFSLLDGIEFRIPMGLSLTSSNPLHLMKMVPLFTWFGDDAIQLSTEHNSFSQLLRGRRDQPLVVWDAPAQVDNSKLLIQCVKTGNIEPVSSNDTTFLRLMAMPFILTTGSTTISFSSEFIPIEIGSSDLEADAYDIFTACHCYFEDYLTNFMVYVEKSQGGLKRIFDKNMSKVINQSADDLLSLREHLQMLAIFRSVLEIMVQYYDELCIPQKLRSMVDDLLSDDSETLLIAALQQTSRYQDSSDAAEAVFFTNAKQMLLDGEFDLRKMSDENINASCASDRKGIVFWDQSMVGFTTDAFREICNRCGYSTRQIAQALMETNAFIDRPLNKTTYLSKLHGVSLQTKSDYVPVYKFATTHFALPMQPKPKLKDSSECSITLDLGVDINGEPILWSGTNNSHICITGSTGYGKSYRLKKMIAQLPSQDVRCIIFDTAGDFARSSDGNPPDWPPAETEIIDISDNGTQINPFLPLFSTESNEMIASRFTDLLAPLLKLGAVQEPLLRQCIQDGLDNHYLSSLSNLCEAMENGGLHPCVARKIESLCSRLPNGTNSMKWNIDKPGITILNLHNYCGDETIQLLLEFFLSNICTLRMSIPHDSYPPVVLVLDECQLVRWDASASVQKILRRGRKYGLAAWLSTQYVTEKMTTALEQADLRIYFKPTINETPSIARTLTTSSKQRKQYEAILSGLTRGRFVCKLDGQVYLSAPPV